MNVEPSTQQSLNLKPELKPHNAQTLIHKLTPN